MGDSRELAERALNAIWYGASPWRWLLWPAALVFRALVAIRRLVYRMRWAHSVDVGVPVIVIGNLSVGGTGKTPLVIWLAEQLGARGYRVGIVCRGYGGKARRWPQPVARFSDALEVGDEARLIAMRTSCPVVAGPDRAAAALMLLRPGALDIILADDGLQHYRLRRAIEIAVVDGTRGLGNGLCLPAGPLREPPSRLAEVDAVVVNDGRFGHAGVLRAKLRVTRVYELASGQERPLAAFGGERVHAVAAIGNPGRFFATLADAGIEVEPHPHPDHAVLAPGDLAFGDGAPVLITEKDAVKCERLKLRNIWCVVTALEFEEGHGERLLRNLQRLLEKDSVNR